MHSGQSGSHQGRITIIVSANRTRLAKIIGPDGAVISAPGRGTEFFVYDRPLRGLADVYALLLEIAPQPDRAVIRDELKPSLSYDVPHRRNRQTFDEVAHHWLMLDIDGIEAPPGMSPTDPYAVDWLVKNHLPREFAEASYIIQFSSSAGTAKAGRKFKVHLWFWLATPARSGALIGWAKSCRVDPSVYHTVQIHYTADPIFEGCPDPLPGPRILFVQKAQEAVALTLPDAPRSRFKQATAAPTAAVVGECGTLTGGRERWLLAWNVAHVRATLAAGLPLDTDRMTGAACTAFYATCSNADGKWPPERITVKVCSTIRRAESGDIPGLPRVVVGLSPHWNLVPVTIADIRAALGHHGAEFFAGLGPDVLALAYPPGTGKTHTVAQEVKAAVARGATIAIYTATVALAVDVAEKIGPDARVIRGRDQPDPDHAGQRMCVRSDVARAVGEAGHSVGRSLCPDCPFRAECSYQAQFINPPAVRLFSHAYLTIPPPAGWEPPGCVVIDEAFWQVCVEVRELPFASFAQAFPPGFAPLWGALLKGLQGGDVLASLRALPDVAELLDDASRLIFQGTTHPKFSATATAADVQRRAGGQRHAAMVSRILCTVREEMITAPGRAISHIVRLVGGTLHLSFPKELRALDGVPRVLVIDAQADPGILERVLHGRNIRFERKDAIRNADVVQVVGSDNGSGRLEADNGLVAKVVRFAEWVGSENAWLYSQGINQKTALFTLKAARRKLTGEPKDGGTLPVSYALGPIDIAHLGNVKGSNIFKNHQYGVVLGRSQPPPLAIENLSGLFWRDAEPLEFTGEYVRQDRGYCHPSGRGASVWVHPDPRCQSLLEQFREWECVQALDRLRLYGDTRKEIYLFTNLVLPIHVSRFVAEHEAIPTWRDLALQNGGLILDSPTWLAKSFPARFATASVAKDWLKEGWHNKAISNSRNVGEIPACAPNPFSPTVVQHRPKPTRASRASGFKRALHIGNPSDIPAALEKATGKPTEFIAYLLGGAAMFTNVPMPGPECESSTG